MHPCRMCTVRGSAVAVSGVGSVCQRDVCPGGVCPRVSVQGGCLSKEGVCPGRVSAGVVSAWEVSARGMSAWGCAPAPVNRIIDSCKNITFP